MKIGRSARVKLLRAKRFCTRFWNKALKNYEMTSEQKRGLRIFEETLSIKDVNIFISPMSDTIYIYVNEIYLILEDHELRVVNGMYNHDFQYDEKGKNKMRNRVFYLLEKRREAIEEKIKSKDDKTLDFILGDIRNIKQRD